MLKYFLNLDQFTQGMDRRAASKEWLDRFNCVKDENVSLSDSLSKQSSNDVILDKPLLPTDPEITNVVSSGILDYVGVMNFCCFTIMLLALILLRKKIGVKTSSTGL